MIGAYIGHFYTWKSLGSTQHVASLTSTATTSTVAASFITPELLSAFDCAIASSLSSLHGGGGGRGSGSGGGGASGGGQRHATIASTSAASSTQDLTGSGGGGKSADAKRDEKARRVAGGGDRSRHASGVEKGEKKATAAITSGDEARKRHDSDSPGPQS